MKTFNRFLERTWKEGYNSDNWSVIIFKCIFSALKRFINRLQILLVPDTDTVTILPFIYYWFTINRALYKWSQIDESQKYKIITLSFNYVTHSTLSKIQMGRSRLQISARRPAILTDVCRGFLQSLQANVGVLSSFTIHHSLITLRFDAI
jgi:hypothetical protein